MLDLLLQPYHAVLDLVNEGGPFVVFIFLNGVILWTITIEYEDGSVATVLYSGAGASSMPKERVEVLRGGRSWVLDDFRTLTSYGLDGERVDEAPDSGKGHAELMARVLSAAVDGPEPVVTGDARVFDVRHVLASPDKAAEGLGFRAEVAPEDGIARLATDPLRRR